MSDEKTLPETGFVRLQTVFFHFPLSKTTWWNGVIVGIYPQSVKLSLAKTTWFVEDIRELIEKNKPK